MRRPLSIVPLVIALLGWPQAASAQGDVDDDLPDDANLDAFEDDRRRVGPLIPEDIDPADLAQSVLIVPMTGETAESTGVGVLLEGFLLGALADVEHFTVVSLGECPQVEDVDAVLYYEGCPPGNELGCQFVIGEVAGVDRVVGGRVTVMSEGRYRVVVSVLNVSQANEEFTYALDLAAGEEELLPRTVELALDRLQRELLLAPYRDAVEQEEARRRAMEEARSEEERRLVARMDIDADESHIERAEEAARPDEEEITQEDVDEIREAEGLVREWEELGITERQYLSYKNSRLDWDDWRWRWAGHRFQILGSINLGFIGGATGLRYYGAYLLNPGLDEVVDNYSWQRLEKGSSFNLGASIGFGILRNLDVEFGGWWARSTVWVKIYSGDTLLEDGTYVPNPENHPPPEFSRQTVNLWGGELMIRYFILTIPIIRPSVAVGMHWITYPTLWNNPEVPDDQEDPEPSIKGYYMTYRQVTDFGIQVEPGVQVDIGKHLGIFLRVPIGFGLNPSRLQSSGDHPPPIIRNADEPGRAPFGTVRVVVGVQGRILGLPVQPKVRLDDVLDEDTEEYKYEYEYEERPAPPEDEDEVDPEDGPEDDPEDDYDPEDELEGDPDDEDEGGSGIEIEDDDE